MNTVHINENFTGTLLSSDHLTVLNDINLPDDDVVLDCLTTVLGTITCKKLTVTKGLIATEIVTGNIEGIEETSFIACRTIKANDVRVTNLHITGAGKVDGLSIENDLNFHHLQANGNVYVENDITSKNYLLCSGSVTCNGESLFKGIVPMV